MEIEIIFSYNDFTNEIKEFKRKLSDGGPSDEFCQDAQKLRQTISCLMKGHIEEHCK